jgi:hypothetical protein
MGLESIFKAFSTQAIWGAVLIMLGSHAFLYEVAAACKAYAEGGSFGINFKFGSSSQEILVRAVGFVLILWGLVVIGMDKFWPLVQ